MDIAFYVLAGILAGILAGSIVVLISQTKLKNTKTAIDKEKDKSSGEAHREAERPPSATSLTDSTSWIRGKYG